MTVAGLQNFEAKNASLKCISKGKFKTQMLGHEEVQNQRKKCATGSDSVKAKMRTPQ